jgi:hypothetical protein
VKGKFLSGDVIWLPFRYCLFTRPKDYFDSLKKAGIDKSDWGEFVPGDKGAATHFWRFKDLQVLIVCMDRNCGKDPLQITSLLFHEAVHIWQELIKHMGEKEPSDEFMAYSIQWIGQQLCYEFRRQVKRRKGE